MAVIGLLFEFACAVGAMPVPSPIAHLFTEDAQFVSLVEQSVPVFVAGMSLFGLQIAMRSIFMGCGQAKFSLAVATA